MGGLIEIDCFSNARFSLHANFASKTKHEHCRNVANSNQVRCAPRSKCAAVIMRVIEMRKLKRPADHYYLGRASKAFMRSSKDCDAGS